MTYKTTARPLEGLRIEEDAMLTTMMRIGAVAILTAIPALSKVRAEDVVQDTATIEFHPAVLTNWDSSKYPTWILKAGTEEGTLDPIGKCWSAGDSLPEGKGQCWIDVNRETLHTDVALTLLFEAMEGADVAVQLWDDTNRVVVVDLFMNVIETAKELKTHTFIIPLQKYPTAKRIVIRRVLGSVKVYGAVMTPVVSEAEGDLGELLALARILGDPLSRENPVVKALRSITRPTQQGGGLTNTVEFSPKPDIPTALQPTASPRASPTGLAAYYDFDEPISDAGLVSDKSGNGLDLAVVGKPVNLVGGVFGKAALLDGSYFKAERNPLIDADNFTISLWFKTASPTDNYKLVAAARWAGNENASGWNVGTHYSEFWADNHEGSLRSGGWERNIQFHKGEWNHLAVAFDGKQVREYINGRLSFESPLNGKKVGAGMPMTVGAWMGGFQFRGVMDELRIYRRTLKEDEIASMCRVPSEPN
jgi:hypothetical protein